MARRKYKKTKRKLSRKVIHKTRRRTKNRVKKLSKNQSGGMIVASVEILDNIRSQIAPATKKRGRFSSSSSVSDTAPTKRTKPTLSDEELGKLIINSLFKEVTNVSFIQDSSRYGFILYATVPTGTLFDTSNLPLSQVLDTSNIDIGIPLQHFCMKISLVLTKSNEDEFENYEYLDNSGELRDKRAISVRRSTKEANDQKNLHDSFACIRGTSPFVPDVIAHGVFNHDNLENYIRLFETNRLAAASATETVTVAGIDRRVLHVLREISEWLQQKNIEDGRKLYEERQNWAVDILLMEYIDKTEYLTLNALGSTYTWGSSNLGIPTNIEPALLTSAAQLACATGVGIILYDCHKDNILSNKTQTRVVLIDIGGAIDYSDEGDKQFILRTFDTMLGILSGENPYCSIEQLRAFFGGGITAAIPTKLDKKGKKGKQEPNILTQKLKENLGTLVDFRCGEFTIEHIHHNLIMTAFVDFMMFIVVHNDDRCQSRYTMESVYGADSFSDFSTFLTRFRPNDRTFRSSGPSLESYDSKLSVVSQEISKIVELCSSVKCPADPKLLRSLLSSSATLPPELLKGQPPGQAPTLPPAAATQPPQTLNRCAIM